MKADRNDRRLAPPEMSFLSEALATLRKLANGAGSKSDGQALLRVVNALMEQRKAAGCAIFLQRPGNTGIAEIVLDLGIARGMESPLLDLSRRLSIRAVRTGAPCLEPDVSCHSATLHGSLLLLPIGYRTEPLGTLVVWIGGPPTLSEWDRDRLAVLCRILGLYCARQAGVSAPQQPIVPCALCAGGIHVARRTASIPASGPAGSRRVPERRAPTLDPQTGVLDRASFERMLDELLGQDNHLKGALYLLHIDVDRYRAIRHFGGDGTAERVIQVLADTVQRQVGHEMAAGRLGSDELGILARAASVDEATELAQRLIDAVDALELSYAGQSIDISISVGLAPYSSDWVSNAIALQQAQEACNAAQRHGGGTFQVYSEALSRQARTQEDGLMLHQLSWALKESRLILYAQPIVSANEAANGGAIRPAMHEILVRMQDKRGIILNAAEFLPLAERYGLSAKLDRWVVRETLRILASRERGIGTQGVFALNLSGHSIDDRRLLELIVDQFRITGLAPERICFELTETAAISDIDAARHFIQVLKGIGCKFALDDFGSGHSSFLYLRDLEVDYLKIDGHLVRDITHDPVSQAFVRSIDDVGKIMGKLTVAEHVESPEVLDAVVALGIDFAQGYGIGPPIPLSQLLG